VDGAIKLNSFLQAQTQAKMSQPFHQLPHKATIPLEPFSAEIPESVLEDLKRRIDDTPEIRETYETTGRAERDGEDLGVKKDWTNEALKLWTGDFKWYVSPAVLCRFGLGWTDIQAIH
jgi:hypothetical protein